ncbi:MAG: response regulator [Nitrospirae bacterium]|nr:response regulator [Nitrospirota bacterium]
MKILVVDDEQLVRWFLDRALKKGGHDVITASNIGEASEKLASEEIDLLFVDLRMPEGNGTELIKKVGDLHKKPRVIVCSAFITTELEDEFRSKGICILKKPFKLDELNNTLRKCLEGEFSESSAH